MCKIDAERIAGLGRALQRGVQVRNLLLFPERERRIIGDEIIADGGLLFQRRGLDGLCQLLRSYYLLTCSETIDAAIVATDHYFSIRHGGGALHGLADFVGPKLFPVLRDHIDAAIVRADHHFVAATTGELSTFPRVGKTKACAVGAVHAMKLFVAPPKTTRSFVTAADEK